MIVTKQYSINSELGDIDTISHTVESGGKTVYNSGLSFFEETASREKFKSIRFKELALMLSTGMSVRKGAQLLNRVRHEKDGIRPTTYRNLIEREGTAIHERLEQVCGQVLVQGGFDSNGTPGADGFVPEQPKTIAQALVEDAAIGLKLWGGYEASDYESPQEAVNLSIDDVCVKRQTAKRPARDRDSQPKRVYNTVIHVESGRGLYLLNAAGVAQGIRLVISLLLLNGLLGKQIVIFADGARDIHNAVSRMLWFANYKIILDWYHLKKKCQEQLSMALRNSTIRNEFLEELLACLWFGNIDGAIRRLEEIEPHKIKNKDYITKLVEYLQRVRDQVPCYAMRKALGLRNSSNRGEKANDIVVSKRQKHNGMSWSDAGSMAFATVAAAEHNQEIEQWIHKHDISPKLKRKAA